MRDLFRGAWLEVGKVRNLGPTRSHQEDSVQGLSGLPTSDRGGPTSTCSCCQPWEALGRADRQKFLTPSLPLWESQERGNFGLRETSSCQQREKVQALSGVNIKTLRVTQSIYQPRTQRGPQNPHLHLLSALGCLGRGN